jgi:hypothetical protein
MDYSQLTPTILPKVMEAMRLINNPEIDPEVRQLNQEILFREVGQAVYAKVYDMNAFDMEIPHTTGPGLDDRYYGLAKVASASVSNGELGVSEYVASYINSVTALAQQHAMTNARQSGKHPTVIRSTVGTKTCQWCRNLAGTYTDPSSDVFRRHSSCDCSIRTEGYMSRNGLLDNYVKPQKN